MVYLCQDALRERHGMGDAWDREIAGAMKSAASYDDVMLGALRGAPFWGTQGDPGEVRGLGEFLPPAFGRLKQEPNPYRFRGPKFRASGGMPGRCTFGSASYGPAISAPDDVLSEVERISAAVRAPIEIACKAVLALGYAPDDCLIEHHAPTVMHLSDLADRAAQVSREVLVVRGVPAFEVETRVLDFVWTVTPRVLTWPQPITENAPGPRLDDDPGGEAR
jgi:hypothetical protein